MNELLDGAFNGEQTISERWRMQLVQHELIVSFAEQLYTPAVILGEAHAASRVASKRNIQ